MKKYYFPNDEYVDEFFGNQLPCCIDESEVARLANGWGFDICEVTNMVHFATDGEMQEYGISE